MSGTDGEPSRASAGPGTPDVPGARDSFGVRALALALLATALPYLFGLGNGFVWLDRLEIVEGALLVHDADGILSLFRNDGNFAGYHRPVYNLLHSLDFALWGLDPTGFLASSLVLHLLNVALAFAVLRGTGIGRTTAAVIAGGFGLHPVNSAVAGLIHAKADLAYVAGGLGAWLAFQRVGRAETVGRSPVSAWCGVGGALLVALFAKENALLFAAFATLLVVFAPRGSVERRRLSSLSALAWAITTVVIATRWSSLFGGHYVSPLGLGERLATFADVYVGYAAELVLPVELSICDTVTRFSARSGPEQVRILAIAAALVGAQAWAAVRVPRLRPWLLLYNVALVPVAQIVPALHFRADRFLYLPSLAFTAIAVLGAGGIVERLRVPPARVRLAGSVFIGVVAIAFGGRILSRLGDFESDETLFVAELTRTPDYREGLSVLARSYDLAGRHDEAAALFERALASYPGRVSYLDEESVVLAFVFNLLARGRVEEARAFVRANAPRVTRPRHREELAYNLAVAELRLGNPASALPVFEAYTRNHPGDPSSHYLLGRSAQLVGERDLARAAFERYLELAPGAPDRAEVAGRLAELAAPR